MRYNDSEYCTKYIKMKNMSEKVHSSINRQCHEKGFAAPVDVLIEIGVLDRKKYEDWRRGRVPYLEAVCVSNLHKLSEIMKTVKTYAKENDLKMSVADYRQWGNKSRKLRFSKSGNPNIEKAYATHYYVDHDLKK